jgi:serine protease Do
LLAALCLAHAAVAQVDDRVDLRAAIGVAKGKVYPALVNIQVVVQDFQGGRAVRSLRAGSGTIIDVQGHVLTNYHVARDAVRVVCTLPSGQQLRADVVGHDGPTDISVLRLRLADRGQEAGPLPFASLGDSDRVEVGDLVLAVGNPLSLSSSMTLGIVSNTRRVFLSGLGNELEELDFGSGDRTGLFTVWIQHDALILPGNSGGPLVDLEGQIIGVNTRATTGYGFASPANLVKRVVAQIIAHGEVRRGFLGAAFQPVAKLGRDQGAVVAAVVAGSPAAAAGLVPGDVVLALAGEPVVARFFEEIPLLYGRIADLSPDQAVTIDYERDGKRATATATLARMEDYLGREVEMRDFGVRRPWRSTAAIPTPRASS